MKNKKLKIFYTVILSFLILLFSISSFTHGQRNYLFENISIPQGLSNSTVNYVFHDSNGFLWISTADGLNKYDGNKMVVYKNDPNDSTTIPNNYCSAISEDSDGFIWIGVLGNVVAKYDPKDESFKRYRIETGGVANISEFYSALYDSKGNLWFGSSNHGMQKFNKSKNRFEQVHLDSLKNNAQWGQIYAITELKNGNILASDYASGIKIYNDKLNLFQPYYLKTNFSPNEINLIYEDASGNIWFGGRNKLIRYYPKYYSTEDYDVFNLFKKPTTYDNVTGLIQDDEGYLWAGVYAQGLYRINPKTKNMQNFDYGFDNSDIAERIIIQTLYKDRFGIVWIGTFGGGLTKFDPLREPFNYSNLKSEEITGSGTSSVNVIAGSQQNNEIIVGTSTKGLFSYNLVNKKLAELKINFNPSSITDKIINVQSLAVDNEGNRWFAYNNSGLNKIDKNNSIISIKSPHEKKTSAYTTNSIKIDLSGNVWTASLYGFEKYNPDKKEFSLLPTIMNKKMSENLKRKIYEITESREPLSSILKVGEASNIEKKFSLNRDQKVLIICVGEGVMSQGNDGVWDKGSLLTGEGKLIWSMNDLSRTFNDGGGFKNRIAVKCVDLKKGDYKIAFSTDVGNSYSSWNVLAPPDSVWYGIQVLNINESEFNSINAINEKEISSDKFMPLEIGNSIELSKKLFNVIWLGSRGNGFFRYDLSTGNFKQYNYDAKNKFSPNNSITYIFEDREGIVWIATQSSLLRFDPATEKIEKFDQKDGLPSNQVNSIIEDLQGNLWIGTSGGLSKLNKNVPKDKWNFVNYDTRDGLQGFSSSKATWISNSGEIILGSSDGIISFYPGKTNEVKPDIVIYDIKIDEVSLKSDSTMVNLEHSIMKTDELVLSYTQNNISFEFASIHFSRPGKNKIMYMLEGFNNHWIAADRNFASYTNLSPGEYTFRVKGSNGDGIWNDTGKSIRIIILPPWWKTTFAYIGYLFLFAGIVFGIDRVQRRRLLEKERAMSKEKELEQAKEIEKAYYKLKSAQSQLLHAEKMASLGAMTAGIAHEIKNPLNFVNNFAELSAELLDELSETLENQKDKLLENKLIEIKALINDLKTNLSKISNHGSRADSIVKGMLLHSRGSSSEKVLTNVNDLLDQFVNLAYHGLRAQDKEFNISIEKDYDNSIEKINIIPQDLSRVFLNVVNNACYAANEKKHQSDADFMPAIKVSTKNLQDKVEIRIWDNGNGIPQSIRENLFNPFFTTKPTGEGTGLGLSLSYDIVVKQHSGEITFESEEGKYTEFIIILPKK